MADTKHIPVFTEAMLAEIAADPPRDRWKDMEGFNTASLGAWLDVCKAAGVHTVPASEIARIEIETLMVGLDDPESTEETDATRTLRTFWTKIEEAKKPGTMIRWDCCTCAEVKYRLATGRHEWHQDLLDYFYVDDFRATDIIFEYPGAVMAAWSRPWMQARIVDGYPVEYRVYVEDDEIRGISSYYPQRPLPDSAEVREDAAACLHETSKLIAALPVPFKYPGWHETPPSPDSRNFTADFMRLEDGRFLYLEGGPPFGAGAHPCCFEHFDKWDDGASFHLSGVPVVLEGGAS